jgi:putative SOS response-associated peptidase YedK
MCGRYVYGPATRDYWVELQGFLDALGPRYNVAVTSTVPILKADREPAAVRWGLIPSWSKDNSMAVRCFNARADSVADKPAFRAAFKKRRCIVLADGYYEWTGPKNDKRAHYIHMPDGRPMVFYGLWESWAGPKDAPLAEPLETCAIITTDAAPSIEHIHNRMPALTDPDDEAIDLWLDPEFEDYNHLESLLVPYEGELLEEPKSKYVNNVRNQGPECLENVEE